MTDCLYLETGDVERLKRSKRQKGSIFNMRSNIAKCFLKITLQITVLVDEIKLNYFFSLHLKGNGIVTQSR